MCVAINHQHRQPHTYAAQVHITSALAAVRKTCTFYVHRCESDAKDSFSTVDVAVSAKATNTRAYTRSDTAVVARRHAATRRRGFKCRAGGRGARRRSLVGHLCNAAQISEVRNIVVKEVACMHLNTAADDDNDVDDRRLRGDRFGAVVSEAYIHDTASSTSTTHLQVPLCKTARSHIVCVRVGAFLAKLLR